MKKKISFITCVNDEKEYEECIRYIKNIRIPKDFELEMIPIRNSKSMTAAYNYAMNKSKAEYKVYIHEGTMIINKNFIYDIVEIFKDDSVGMIGVIGCERLTTEGVWWKAVNQYGKVYESSSGIVTLIEKNNPKCEEKYKVVEAVDGLVMVTRCDIKWREDLFDGYDMYDISQCIEFKKKGLKVVVPYQQKPWCIHDCKISDYSKYNHYVNIFLDEYSKDLFPLVSILIPTYNRPEFFKIALESAVKQTYRNIEILVGDDSTNEFTKNIMRYYLDKYSNINYIYNNGPMGDFGINNDKNLLRLCKGEYVNFLMDDDIFAFNKIERMVNYYIQYPNVSLVTSFRKMIDKNGNFLEDSIFNKAVVEKDTILDGQSVGQALLEGGFNFIGEPTTALVKRNMIHGFIGNYLGKDFVQMGDYTQWLECCRFGDIAYIVEPLSCFRVHEGQKQCDVNVMARCLNETYECVEISAKNKCFIEDDESCNVAYKKWLIGAEHFASVNNLENNKLLLERINMIKKSIY